MRTITRFVLAVSLILLSLPDLRAQQPAARVQPPNVGSLAPMDYEAPFPPTLQQEVITIKAQDGGVSYGVLYTPKNKRPETAILDMHPQVDRTRHFLIPGLAEAGYAVFGHDNRYLNNDAGLIHEKMLLDIAAGVKFLRSRGYSKVVLLGASGGGSLVAFYQAQAVTEPPDRAKGTPAGDPPDLNEFDLPQVDGLLTVIPHLGEGKIMEARIDPSVVTEGDPLSVDPSLDMYNPANGFRYPPEPTVYSREFVARYQAAQHARMERLDRSARDLIAEQNRYRDLMKQPGFKNRPADEQQWIERNALTERMMHVYRTWADLRYMDLTLDPSDRVVGDNSSLMPWRDNYALPSTSAYVSPRAFLSTRSSVSSQAVTATSMAKVTVPTAIIQGTAHRQIYPSDTKAIFESIAAKDKKLIWIEGGDMNFGPSGPKYGKGDQQQQCIDAAIAWMKQRFP